MTVADRLGYMEVPTDVLDIGRRIREGDETGWPGDPTMGLYVNPATGMFEVIGRDARGDEYVATTAEVLDHRIILQLIAGDWRRDGGRDVVARTIAHNEKLHAARQAELAEQAADVADRIHFAMVRDTGHLYGQNRRLYAVTDPRGK